MQILFFNWLTFAIAISAFVYSAILTEPGQILAGLSSFLEHRLPEWLFKPLIGCQYCVSGQWALWSYLYITLVEHVATYHWWIHIWVIMQTIMMVKIVTYLYLKFIEK